MSQPPKQRTPRLQAISDAIGTFPDFPLKGINFRDIFGALHDPAITHDLLDEMKTAVRENVLNVHSKIDAVVGLDARGFPFGLPLSTELNCAFVAVRKAGKLPGECYITHYVYDYSEADLELQKHALKSGDKVLIVDDLLATGGTILAAAELVRKAGAIPVAAIVVTEALCVPGRERLEKENIAVHSLLVC